MLNTVCIPCQHGDHAACQGGQASPEGLLGGWRCVCDHQGMDEREARRGKIDFTIVEDQDGWRGVYLNGVLVTDGDVLDADDILNALKKRDDVQVGDLHFPNRTIEDWPERFDTVLVWQVED